MNDFITYFTSILPYNVCAAYTGLSLNKDYFYISSTQSAPTQLTHYYIVSTDILIKADTGSKYYGTFMNYIEIYKRENKSWTLLSKSSYTSLKFSIEVLKSKSTQLLKDALLKRIPEESFTFKKELDEYVNSTIQRAFSNQYCNLASLYLNEI